MEWKNNTIYYGNIKCLDYTPNFSITYIDWDKET